TEGAYYRITDNRTKHIILDTNVVNTGPIEPLVILASSKNTFNSEAFSTVHLFDKIEYNFDDNLCEDGVTERTGKITSRIDTIKNIGSLNEDYRNIKYRLYDITGIEHETAVQTSSSLFSLTTVRGVVPSEPDWNYE